MNFIDEIFKVIFSVLLIIGIIFGVKGCNQKYQLREKLNQMEYEMTEESYVELHSLSDGHTTSGRITYARGVISSSYNIYYSFKEDDGNIVIRSFPYNEETTKIYEEEGIEPSLIIRQYERRLEDFYDEYATYELHIPTGTMDGVSISMD